jgi:hypothetical protein
MLLARRVQVLPKAPGVARRDVHLVIEAYRLLQSAATGFVVPAPVASAWPIGAIVGAFVPLTANK